MNSLLCSHTILPWEEWVPQLVSSSTISCFLVYLSQRTSSYRYILNHVNSIRVFHLYYDLPCDALSSLSVRLITQYGVEIENILLLWTCYAAFMACWTPPLLCSPRYGACFSSRCLLLFSPQIQSDRVAPSAQVFDP